MTDEYERAAETLAALTGGAELIDWFGHPTAFHDFTILSMDLGDCSTARMRVHGWRATGETGADGCWILDRHAVVTITMTGIVDLDLHDLHMMPAIIFHLDFERSDGMISADWDSSYGAFGSIRAREARIGVTPGKPGA